MREIAAALALLFCVGCGAPQRDPSQDAARALTRAGLLAQRGQLAEAADAYDVATTLAPESVENWLSASRSRARLGQWAAASARARRAQTLAPDSVRVAHRLGLVLIAGAKWAEARTLYDALTLKSPESPEAWLGLGIVAELQGEVGIAESALARSARLDPSSADVWARLGAARERLRRPAAAAAAFAESVTIKPRRALAQRAMELALHGGDREVARRLAGVLAKKGTPKWGPSLSLAAILLEREDAFGAASELEFVLAQEDVPEARLMLAHILGRVGRREEALAHLERINKPSMRADILHLQGVLYLAEGQVEVGLLTLRAAAAAAPDRATLALALGRAEQSTGHLKRAEVTLRKATHRWPLDVNARYLHALVLHDLKQPKAAMGVMRAVISLAPRHAGALNYIGYSLADAGVRLDEAERLIRRALEAQPGDASIIDSLGWVQFRQGQLEAAEASIRQALKLDPSAAEVRFHLAMVLRAVGDLSGSLAALKEAIKGAESAAMRGRFRKIWRKRRPKGGKK